MGMHHTSKDELDMPEAVKILLGANLIAYVVTFIFILLASLLLTYTTIDNSIEDSIMIVGIIISAFVAGFDTAKVENRNGYRWGAVGGSLYFVIFLVIGTLMEKLDRLSPATLFIIAFTVLMTSTIAGIISVNCSNRK